MSARVPTAEKLYGMLNDESRELLGQNVCLRERGQTQLLGTVSDVEWNARHGDVTMTTVRFVAARRYRGVTSADGRPETRYDDGGYAG